MEINGVEIEDTFAEAFGIKVSRVLVTAATKKLAKIAATEATGYGTSVIGCPAEAGIDCYVPPEETPDGRPGYIIMICNPSKKSLDHELLERIGMGILTAPTTAVFDALDDEDEKLNIGFKLKFFGDGYEKELEIDGRKIHSIPIMSGDFLIESEFGIKDGVAGGNFFIMGDSQSSALLAAQAAVDAIAAVEGTVTPFPGGVVASGSKVGSNKYKFLNASTNEKMCVTLKDEVEDTQIPENVNGVYEIVIDGVDEEAVREAMKEGIKAACTVPGIIKISAGNYGGNLGAYKIKLHDLF
ncbi:tetrahydromethanopterin formyltransferase [Methanothermobacter sp. CaT2]|jgi:formylmethanofuran--tetrahydromethanopterin N-formyltransferase|uniref:Formylmethanofuran--tetrahydromethanopterin formyltransferase n=1 Tax=Methanothermobacter defluvii TaxID=49339 RepID=A0A371NDZ7_9EURY|nr:MULTISPECIES: formylmethanofuran--tetrahydromethanopterin N-formyltransferase [Methanothermobacter]MDN5373896.1 formylmethanofuran--tetrahydromethanopterin N-formyltransferase [Methanothermobacter sp.]NLU04083.1 formylmethanofuran--tetrahydromethanopterin N-formyltransferase [Methanothermobacter sp.]REE28126.1 formylmethanofuran-tetrahydromethanopterin formyltransferase [Methanothermobacter defluvii]WBF09051.1 formylmethanofuran--tetrahydromethanopterin N-formyltransferase [Methanothermobact